MFSCGKENELWGQVIPREVRKIETLRNQDSTVNMKVLSIHMHWQNDLTYFC